MNGVSIHSILASLAVVAGGILGGYLLSHLFHWLSRKADQGRYQIDGILLRIFGPPASVLVALVSVNYALYRIP
ncbi:MAG: hypothetical protein ABEK84_10420 [Salinibacter sp.]